MNQKAQKPAFTLYLLQGSQYQNSNNKKQKQKKPQKQEEKCFLHFPHRPM